MVKDGSTLFRRISLRSDTFSMCQEQKKSGACMTARQVMSQEVKKRFNYVLLRTKRSYVKATFDIVFIM